MALNQFLTADIAVDMGTGYSRIYVKGKGIVVNEPSILAVRSDNHKVVAIGEGAEEIAGRSSAAVHLEYPIRNGKIVDLELAQIMLQYFVNKALGMLHLKPRLITAKPIGTTKLEETMLMKTIESVGGRNQIFIDQIIAAGLGAGLPVYEPQGSFIIDMGAGKTQIALVSMGGMVVSYSDSLGGERIDREIAESIKRKHDIVITQKVAEQIKMDLIDIKPVEKDDRFIIVRGRDIATGMPTTADVSMGTICEAICSVVTELTEMIKRVLTRVPPELCIDIAKNGIYLCGGTSQLPKLDVIIKEDLGIPVHIAKEAGESVVLGLGYVADHYDVYSGNSGKKN